MSTDADQTKWQAAIDAVKNLDTSADAAPNVLAVAIAVRFLDLIRAANNCLPPTLISREPAGGIVIEMKSRHFSGRVFEFTVTNQGTIERAEWVNGVVQTITIGADISQYRKSISHI